MLGGKSGSFLKKIRTARKANEDRMEMIAKRVVTSRDWKPNMAGKFKVFCRFSFPGHLLRNCFDRLFGLIRIFGLIRPIRRVRSILGEYFGRTSHNRRRQDKTNCDAELVAKDANAGRRRDFIHRKPNGSQAGWHFEQKGHRQRRKCLAKHR